MHRLRNKTGANNPSCNRNMRIRKNNKFKMCVNFTVNLMFVSAARPSPQNTTSHPQISGLFKGLKVFQVKEDQVSLSAVRPVAVLWIIYE